MKIAIFWPNWIGDAVMATPAAAALQRFFADAKFVHVLKPYVLDVVQSGPWGDHFLFLNSSGPWGHRWPAAAWQLRRQAIDLAVLFPNTFRSALVAWLAGCKRRIGFARHGRNVMLTDALQPKRDAKGKLLPCPIIDDYNRLATHVGCLSPGHRMELATSPQAESLADQVWQRAWFDSYPEVVCLNPGAAFGAAKHWPANYFASLARDLVDQRGCGVLVLCGPAERQLAKQIADLSQRPEVHSLADFPMSIGLTKACIRRSDLLVTTDSGPRHFAAAFDVPVVTLFGPTHIAWTETYYSKAVHLQKKVDCGPCQQRVCHLDHRCMSLLTPNEVFSAAQTLLSRHPKSNHAA